MLLLLPPAGEDDALSSFSVTRRRPGKSIADQIVNFSHSNLVLSSPPLITITHKNFPNFPKTIAAPHINWAWPILIH
jgi:hypothetical protein